MTDCFKEVPPSWHWMTHTYFKYLFSPLEVPHLWQREQDELRAKQTLYYKVFPLHDLWSHFGNGKQRETFVRFIGDDSLQCFRCLSSACTSCGMLTITASWGIMKQECPFWSTSPNYFVVLRGPLNSSLFKQERVTERDRGPAKAFSLYC